MATFTEDFTALDGTLLTSLSPAWLGSGTVLSVTNNRCRSTNAGWNFNYAPTSPATADQQVTFNIRAASGNVSPGVCLRLSTDGDNCYFAYYGSQWRIGKRVSGVETLALGTSAATAPSSETTCILKVEGTTVSLTIAGVEEISLTDTDVTAAGEWGAFSRSADNSSSRYIDTLSYEDIAAAGLTLDSAPVTMAKAETGLIFTVTDPATTPTTGNSTAVAGSASLTPVSVNNTSGTTWDLEFDCSVDVAKQVGSYAWTITVDAENVVSSSIPLTVQSGWTNIVLSSPLTTIGYMLNGFTGDTPVTGDTMEFETTTDLNPGTDSEWIWDVAPTVTQVVARRVIQVDGTVGGTADVTFLVDTTAPVLSLPTGTKTGSSTATGTVTTDEDNGTLFFYVSINSSETLATIKASGSNQAVSATGLQNVSFSGLAAATTYFAHYIHTDDADNDSNVQSSTSFITDAAPISEGGILRNILRSPLKNILRNPIK